jgi:hypothetical protein
VLQREDMVDFTDLKDLSFGCVLSYSMQERYHLMWVITFFNIDHSSAIIDTDLFCTI